MKNIIKFILLAVVVIGATSCKDFLYPEPVDNLTTDYFYQTDEQVEAAVVSIYVPLRSSYLGSTYQTTFNNYTDEAFWYNSSDDRVGDYTATSSNSAVSNFWSNLYTALKDVAYLIEGLENNQELLTESVYKKAKAEALFFRGYYHFMLAQWFCHPDTGIPLYMTPVASFEDATMDITPLKDYYEQIITDMEASAELLEELGITWASLGYSERVTISAARGMLARVCLFAAGYPNNGGDMGSEYYYQKALENGLAVVEQGHELEDEYSTAFIAPTQDLYVSENIWEVGYMYQGVDEADFNTAGAVGSQFGMKRYNVDDAGESVTDSLLVSADYLYGHPGLYTSYGLGDDRRDWNLPNFFYDNFTMTKVADNLLKSTHYEEYLGSFSNATLPMQYIWGIATGKWRREYEARTFERNSSSTTTNFPLLRYPDVLLMIAEAYIELGQPAEAVPYINEIRHRSVKYDRTGMVKYIVIDETSSYNRGWGGVPEFTITDPDSGGSGFEAEAAIYNSSALGYLCMRITNPGSGYVNAPKLTITGTRTITWQPYTDYKKNDYVAMPTDDTYTKLSLYKAAQDGTSTGLYPTYQEELTGTTTPTATEALELYGVSWSCVKSGYYYATGYAPEVTVYIGDSAYRSVQDDPDYDINSQSSMRDYVREERRRELCFEQLRRQDLKRWGILVETVKEFENDYNGSDYWPGQTSEGGGTGSTMLTAAAAVSEYDNYLPIPLAQLPLNRKLVQNPGY